MDENHNLSSILIGAMRAKGLTTEKLSQQTGISERFITPLLEEDLNKLPALPYAHGYVLKIAETLDLDGKEIWETYFRDNELLKSSGDKDRLPENRFALSWLNKKVLLLAIIILAVAGYFVIRSFFVFDISREIKIEGLENDIVVVSEPIFTIRGKVNPDLGLTINQSRIYSDTSGIFEETIKLDPGLNTVTIILEGLLGKKEKIIKQILYEPSSENSIENEQSEVTTTTQTSPLNQ